MTFNGSLKIDFEKASYKIFAAIFEATSYLDTEPLLSRLSLTSLASLVSLGTGEGDLPQSRGCLGSRLGRLGERLSLVGRLGERL